jgi:hypothetical protein
MRSAWILALLLLVVMTLPGCEAIGTIFKAGIWTGIIAVVLVVGIIGFIVTKVSG